MVACAEIRTSGMDALATVTVLPVKPQGIGRESRTTRPSRDGLYIFGLVRKRTEPLSTEADSRNYDARYQNFGAVRKNPRSQWIGRTPMPFGIS